jgi:hypothetical protein
MMINNDLRDDDEVKPIDDGRAVAQCHDKHANQDVGCESQYTCQICLGAGALLLIQLPVVCVTVKTSY